MCETHEDHIFDQCMCVSLSTLLAILLGKCLLLKVTAAGVCMRVTEGWALIEEGGADREGRGTDFETTRNM